MDYVGDAGGTSPSAAAIGIVLATRREVSIERSEVKQQVAVAGIVDGTIPAQGIEGS